MKPIITIKHTAQGFKMAFSYIHNDKETPIRHIFNSEALVEKFYKICCRDEYLSELFNSERIFSQINVSEPEVVSILKKLEHYQKIGCEIKLSDNIQAISKMELSVSKSKREKMIQRISMDGVELSQDEIRKIGKALNDFIFFNGKWRVVDSKLVSNLSKDVSILETIKALKQSKSDFKGIEWSIKNLPIPCDFKGNAEGFNGVLREYQQKAVELLYGALKCNQNILLADDMGLGKTITILALLNMLNNDQKAPNLVVVPKTLAFNWSNEIKQFAPNVSFCHVDKQIDLSKSVHITTYGHLLNNAEMYNSVNWNLVVLDEAQQIKNHKTKQSQIVCNLRSSHKIAMTGTPIENSVMDLWSIFQFLDKELLGSEVEFKKTIDSEYAFNWLNQMISPFVIRRVKTDKNLGLNLPEKHESIIYCDLTDEQKALYNAVITEFENEIKLARRLNKRVSVFKYISLLKLVCSDIHAILPDNDRDHASGKMNAMVRHLKAIGKAKSIIFTQYRKVAENIHSVLSNFYGKDGLLIDGKLSAKKRMAIAKQFQSGEYPFIVITLKAGNAGLTLTEACNVIHFDRWWNPSVENQATDRAHRIGQTQNVQVVKLVTKGTLEERIDKVLKDKTELFDKIISPLNMSNEEILEFVKFQKG